MAETAVAQALSTELGWRILKLLVMNESTKSRLASQLDVPPTTVASILERLMRAGLVVERAVTKHSGASEFHYALSGDAKTIGFPPRDYKFLSQALITGLVASLGDGSAKLILRDVGLRAGEEMGRTFLLMTKGPKCNPDEYSELFVKKLLAEMGTYPRMIRKSSSFVEYEQLNCPFQELAEKLPALVCDVLDESVHEGLDKKLGLGTTRLSCKGHGASSCRFRVVWREDGPVKPNAR